MATGKYVEGTGNTRAADRSAQQMLTVQLRKQSLPKEVPPPPRGIAMG